jgi:metal-responsive CopG/Arc/MetJ family transcriptional regulator
MKSPTSPVRRSVSLPPDLVDAALESAPVELRNNFNRLVRTALEQYVEAQKKREFQRQMEAMAADPDVQQEVATINREFARAEGDGLSASE